MLDVEHIDHISDEMCAVVESEWPELAHKLPLNKSQGLIAAIGESPLCPRKRTVVFGGTLLIGGGLAHHG